MYSNKNFLAELRLGLGAMFTLAHPSTDAGQGLPGSGVGLSVAGIAL